MHSKRNAGTEAETDNLDDVPELDDVVEEPELPGAAPPPNLDLFADTGLDIEVLRDELATRLNEELDNVLNDLRAEFASLLENRVESRLRERLPAIIDEVLADQAGETPQAD